ncbi:MAG: hypothetical protein DRI74_09865 [Bacteroidetes bacterium]|nr:MAG: hypothetical protein DRI74_09865 [Bacteroidota bacterium]
MEKDTMMATDKKAIKVPLNGILRLCKKLPRIISLAAQILPITAAFNQLSDILDSIIFKGNLIILHFVIY